MGSKLKCMYVVTVGVLMLFTMLIFMACISSTGGTSGFPIGRFVDEYNYWSFEFDEDGTWHGFEGDTLVISGKYAINGNLYTEMTHDYPGSSKIPATYTWTYDGKNLTFQLWGEDANSHRKSVYDGPTYTRSE